MPKSAEQIRRENMTIEVERAGGAREFADRHEENVDYVRQILRGKDAGGRNIGHRAARRLENLLGKPANWLDEDAELRSSDPRSRSLIENRLENDVDALRYALGAIILTIGSRRPDEGADVAATIRKTVPKKFVEQGLVKALLEDLDGVVQKAKARKAVRRS